MVDTGDTQSQPPGSKPSSKSSSIDTLKQSDYNTNSMTSSEDLIHQQGPNARLSPTLQLGRDPSDVRGSISHEQAVHHNKTHPTPQAPPPAGKPLPYEGVVNAAATHVVPQNPPPSGEDYPETLSPKREQSTFSPPIPPPRSPYQQRQEEIRENKEEETGKEHNLGRKAGDPGQEDDVKDTGTEADVKAGDIRELERERSNQPQALLEGETLEEVDEYGLGQRTPTTGSTSSPAPALGLGPIASTGRTKRSKPRRSMTDTMPELTDAQKAEFTQAFGSVSAPLIHLILFHITLTRCQTRIGTSALISALSALPMDPESEDSSDSDSEPERYGTESMTSSAPPKRPQGGFSHLAKAKTAQLTSTVTRLHSSLHTIRPLHRRAHSTQKGVSFPFAANTVARQARSPGGDELAYQLAAKATNGAFDDEFNNDHGEAEEARDILYAEKEMGDASPRGQMKDLSPEEAAERKAARRERLSERMMEVFGLEEKEEVKEEFACWLLKDVSE